MAILPFLTSTYARNIYLSGTTTFAWVQSNNPDYVIPVKQYAASHYTLIQITNALTKTWISQQEYDDTIAYNPSLLNQTLDVPPVTE